MSVILNTIWRAKLLLGIQTNDKDELLEELRLQAVSIFNALRYGSAYVQDSEYESYDTWIVNAVVELYNRLGVEGQISSGVNGVGTVFDATVLSRGLKSQIVPIGRGYNG